MLYRRKMASTGGDKYAVLAGLIGLVAMWRDELQLATFTDTTHSRESPLLTKV